MLSRCKFHLRLWYFTGGNRMTYTKQVREYCQNNQGAVLDVSLLKDSEFSEIPYKTLLKILNRLEEEKLIFGISKGVYAIGKPNVQNEPDIVREYTENGKGMIVGGILYQGLGLSSYRPVVTEIYTNAMTSEHKNIGRFHLTRVNLEFTDSIVNLVVLLKLIRDGYNIKGSDFFTLNATVDDLLSCYSDELFEKVIREIKYPYSVAKMLEKRLAEKRTANHCIEIYKKIYGWCDCAISSRQI